MDLKIQNIKYQMCKQREPGNKTPSVYELWRKKYTSISSQFHEIKIALLLFKVHTEQIYSIMSLEIFTKRLSWLWELYSSNLFTLDKICMFGKSFEEENLLSYFKRHMPNETKELCGFKFV